MQATKKKTSGQIACGVAIGTANGLFGGGGGMVAVPLLQKTGLEGKKAHATAILLILPVAVLSFLVYAFKGQYRSFVAIPTAIGVTIGGVVGAKLLDKLPTKAVNLIFAILQAFAGVFLFFF